MSEQFPSGSPYEPAPPAPPVPVGPTVPYASWFSRVLAAILDGLLELAVGIVPGAIGLVLIARSAETTVIKQDGSTQVSVESASPGGVLLLLLAGLMMFVFALWNMVVRQGKVGATIGKSALGIKVVRDSDGNVLGVGTALLRYIIMSIVGGACFLNYLWPLWDQKRQAWHDMIVHSVVVAAK